MVELHEGHWGGGNQFLKALRNEFIRKNCYEYNLKQAKVIFFNSHHHLDKIIKLKRKFKDMIFVHRVDGPMSYRGLEGKKTDRKIFKINRMVADGTVFQSQWSRSESRKQGMKKNKFETVIHNAPDPDIFYQARNEQKNPGVKINLISTSWSSNPKKGFDIYQYLDENLDFKKYEMTFVGKTDEKFSNIKMVSPLPSKELANFLRKNDIYIFPSKLEACSNSLLEALSCGLPAIARNTSSNPEILGERGLTFNSNYDVISKIEAMANNLEDYRKKLYPNQIEEVGRKYYNFSKKILTSDRQTKTINLYDQLKHNF